MKNLKNRGFTLIELLVVVSIISLLSSVVLASLSDAREKARSTSFRAEMGQFINALELYRLDEGDYPGDPRTSDYLGTRIYENGSVVNYGSMSGNNLETMLSKYISSLPKPYIIGSSYMYYHRHNTNSFRCKGDSSEYAEYFIYITPADHPGFDDLDVYEYSSDGVNWTPGLYKCISL